MGVVTEVNKYAQRQGLYGVLRYDTTRGGLEFPQRFLTMVTSQKHVDRGRVVDYRSICSPLRYPAHRNMDGPGHQAVGGGPLS